MTGELDVSALLPGCDEVIDHFDDPELSSTLAAAFYSPGAPGTARFLVDRERRTLIGCTITGSEIADFLHVASIAVLGELPLERLRHAVPFPTRSEIWLAVLEQAGF